LEIRITLNKIAEEKVNRNLKKNYQSQFHNIRNKSVSIMFNVDVSSSIEYIRIEYDAWSNL
jgi:hypothetical protein